eukprot:TRINITY_DN1767_c0_g2_i1.p1 TRINITY_DN1767_c0_g2~~TRINITY_DN1767_c0_g2_i1.p1  ORF type:complete len:421 (+),score=55.34 TRINITY_DN1767_c0_g2_i1:64-1326(+)
MEKVHESFVAAGICPDGMLSLDDLSAVLSRMGFYQSEAVQISKGIFWNAQGRASLSDVLVHLESVRLEASAENGNHAVMDHILASRRAWAALNCTAKAPAAGTKIPFTLVADQNEGSKAKTGWKSFLARFDLVYQGSYGEQSYAVEPRGESTLLTSRGDSASRGAEYSLLEVVNGRLITACDRTGNVDELVSGDGGKAYEVKPLVDSKGNALQLRTGDGSVDKPLKAEWSAQRNGKLLIGSTGKERTDGHGRVDHEGEMWVKYIDAKDFSVEHVDWRPVYSTLREAARCPHGSGYMIHEAVRWSDIHHMWFFLPRKLSREPYDEAKDASKCVNLMLALQDGATTADVMMQPYLTMSSTRGCSDFAFVPGTKDCHILIIRTEKAADGVVSTFAAVVDLQANVLMTERLLANHRKFEGVAWI